MATFVYEAVDSRGKKVKAEIEASSSQEARNKIQSMGYFPTAVKEKKSQVTTTATAVRKPKGMAAITFGGVSKKQLTQFTTQLSTLQDAGLPIVRSLRILENQMKPCMLKNVVGMVADDIEAGSSFSEALAKHPKVFDRLYVNMIRAGEAGGVLDTILARLAQFMEKAQRLKRRIIGAMVYPVVVILIAVAIVGALMTFVIPKFEEIFMEMGVGALPAPTQILINMSHLIKNNILFLIMLPFILVVGCKLLQRNSTGRYLVDKVKLHIPLFGIIIKKASIARFCRTLGTLITSGVPILEALSIVKNTVGNEVVAHAVGTVHDSIREGESVAEPLSQSGVFDDIVINMIDVGEETGELDKMLIKVADNYDDEVDVAVSGMVNILEPVLIIGLGTTVGFIVISLFLPLMSLVEKLGAGGGA